MLVNSTIGQYGDNVSTVTMNYQPTASDFQLAASHKLVCSEPLVLFQFFHDMRA